MTEKLLTGKKIVVTRAREQAEGLATALEDLGACVIEFSTIKIEPIAARFDVGSMAGFHWAVFTSANAVRCFGMVLEKAGVPFDLQGAKICAVGPATRRSVEERGARVDLIPDEFIAEGIITALEETEEGLAGQRILVPRGELARDMLPDTLRAHGADVAEPIVYRTLCPKVADAAKDALVAARPDIVTFTSASTARHYVQILGAKRIEALGGIVYASIGPQTTLSAETAGLTISIEPQRHDVPGMLEAISRYETRKTT